MWGYVALAGFQIAQGLQQADLIRRNGEISQEIAQLNSQFKELDAWEAEKAGYSQAARYQREIDATVSAQREQYASQNVDVNFGTAAEVQKETRLTGYLNQVDIVNQANQRALGIRREAINIRLGAGAQSSQTELNAMTARTMGLVQGGGTLVSGYLRD